MSFLRANANIISDGGSTVSTDGEETLRGRQRHNVSQPCSLLVEISETVNVLLIKFHVFINKSRRGMLNRDVDGKVDG